MKKIFGLSAVVLAVLTLTGCGESKKNEVAPSVIANLQAAYNGESNAAAKYKMYAENAEKAGYKSVAAMFRATSKSEGIHAARQGKVLKSLGVQPVAKIELPKYVDVKESLKDGIKGETYEMTVMYPEFIADAKAKNAPAEVIEAFKFAMEAEKEHAKFYTDAVANLENFKAAGKTFYVCTVCGYTTNSPVKVCILCAAPGEKFEIFK